MAEILAGQAGEQMWYHVAGGNQTEDAGLAASIMQHKSVQYFMAMYPVFVSLGMGGSALGIVYFVLDFIRVKIMNKLYCSITIKYDDDTFKWVNKFMQETGAIADDTILRAKIKHSSGPWWEEIFKVKDDKKKPDIEYIPGSGNHVFKHKGKRMWVNHVIGKTLMVGWEKMPTELEHIEIITWGNDTQPIKDFIDKCVEYSMEKDTNNVQIYELHRWGLGWTKVMSKRPRPLESVILDKDCGQKLLDDIRQFQASAQWYIDQGIPYRRGYLLHGPPGTGKTSFTLAIAAALKLNICYLNLSSNRLDDDDLNRALNKSPQNSIILLEDIDAIFRQRQTVGRKKKGRQVSFSGLLNALDGVRSQEGRILVMSTNHKEKLDPALIRPGRCDMHLELSNATYEMMKQLFLKFFKGENRLADEFARRLPEGKISMAKLQGHFLKYRQSAEQALEKSADLLKDTEKIAEMTTSEWLDRLNLSKYLPMFMKNQAYLVSELKLHLNILDKSKLNDNFKFKNKLDEQRINFMITGTSEDKAPFQFVTPKEARRIIQKFVKNEAICNKLVDAIPENTMTGFQLQDILIENYSEESLLKAIEDRVTATQNRIKKIEDPRVIAEQEVDEDKEETEDEKKKRYGHPDYDLEQLFKDVGAEESIEKLKEHNIKPTVFWTAEEKDLLPLLDIKLFGAQKKLFIRREEILKAHKKEKEQADEEKKAGKITAEDEATIQKLLQC